MWTLLESFCLAPVRILRACRTHSELLYQLTRRHILGRYKGSYLGLLWSLLNPLLMLVVYTFVFSVIVQLDWDVAGSGSRGEDGLALGAGLSIFNLFTELITRAPTLMLGHANYVKKVVFPLEILPASIVGEALFHSLISFGLLMAGQLIFLHAIPVTALWLPVLLVVTCALTAGLAWFFSALGVFVRDVHYSVVVLATVLFFMSAVFYPISRVPEAAQFYFMLNPVAILVDTARRVVMWGMPPDWPWFGYAAAISFISLCGGFAFFEHTKRSFADVI